jgi:hypothetical protein
MVNIPEFDKPAQLPAVFIWSLPVTGKDKKSVYEEIIKKYSWFERLPMAWVRSINCLYVACDFNSSVVIDPRKAGKNE